MKENKKYELVEEDFILHKGKKLYRIKALKEFSFRSLIVKKGAVGGYVEGYHNLSQEGTCWIGWNAKVYGNARIEDSAIVDDLAEIFGNAEVKENAIVGDCAKVYGNARVMFFATVKENSKIYGNAKVTDSAAIWNSEICGNAKVIDCAKIFDNFLIHGNAIIGEFTELDEGAKEFSGNCAIFDSRYI